MYFRNSVKVYGTWIRDFQKAMLTFENETLVKHVVDCMFDESRWFDDEFEKKEVYKMTKTRSANYTKNIKKF